MGKVIPVVVPRAETDWFVSDDATLAVESVVIEAFFSPSSELLFQ